MCKTDWLGVGNDIKEILKFEMSFMVVPLPENSFNNTKWFINVGVVTSRSQYSKERILSQKWAW